MPLRYRADNRQIAGSCLVLAFLAYYTVAGTVFAYRHPWLTHTQLTLHTWDALTWRTIPKE